MPPPFILSPIVPSPVASMRSGAEAPDRRGKS
jgi:hypothetical protein